MIKEINRFNKPDNNKDYKFNLISYIPNEIFYKHQNK